MERIFFAAVLAIVALTLSPVDAGERKIVEKCLLQTEVTRADFHTVRSPAGANEKVKCFINCAMQGVNWMKVDGSFDLDLIKSNFSPTTASLIDECAAKINLEDSDCHRSYNFFSCFIASDPEVFGKFIRNDILNL